MALSDAQRRALADEVAARAARTRTRIDQLERDRQQLVDATADAPDDEHDPEGATIGFERAQATALLEHARQHLEELAAVRRRLAEPDVGACARCGGPIGVDRLLARPTARHCVACAEGHP